MYYFSVEVYEIYCYSLRKYFVEAGWLNVLDWIGLMSAYQAYVSLGLLVAAMPTLFGDAYQGLESHRRGHYANLSAQNDFQMWLAFCVFLIYFRALK